MQLPLAFTQQMITLLGDAGWQLFSAALDMPPHVSLRLNGSKQAIPSLPAIDSSSSITPVLWSSSGYYLSRRPDFTLDPAFHAGAYYVQEASSMFVEQALRRCGAPKVVLDLCAAPGGKSTLLRSLLPDDALLVCNEPVKARANVLAENIIKWGHEGCLVSCNYPKDFARMDAVFDLILVDAPCSGEGMFRKDNPAVDMWSPANVEECANRQRDILQAIWPTLRDGGHLIYSTCTYNTAENEENVRFICESLGAEAIEIPVRQEWNITGSLLRGFSQPVYRFMPHKTKGEGFFLSLLRKNGDRQASPSRKAPKTAPLPKEYADRLLTGNLVAKAASEVLYGIRAEHAAIVDHMLKSLYPLHMGVALCEQRGRKSVPHHSMAMSRLLRSDAYPKAELCLEDALAYLRHEAIKIDAPRGYIIVTYAGLPLGFVNNLGSRANNLYPAEWRIRKH
jgi:16S rRNA C967 or C1407 C5-methylase (RsmB/RsmF family)/NOL1/NOP2/fmu family ribosome biogenesis protein